MDKFRIITSKPGDKYGAYKAQIKCKFLFWTFWMDICDWKWSIKDCENQIKFYKGEINNVVKEL